MTIEALFSATEYFAIPMTRARKILREVEAAVDAWRTVAVDIGMTDDEVSDYTDAFEHDERQAAQSAMRKGR